MLGHGTGVKTLFGFEEECEKDKSLYTKILSGGGGNGGADIAMGKRNGVGGE